MRSLKTLVLVFALAVVLGGCGFLDSLPAPLFDQSELPGFLVTGHEAVGDGICTALTKLFGGC